MERDEVLSVHEWSQMVDDSFRQKFTAYIVKWRNKKIEEFNKLDIADRPLQYELVCKDVQKELGANTPTQKQFCEYVVATMVGGSEYHYFKDDIPFLVSSPDVPQAMVDVARLDYDIGAADEIKSKNCFIATATFEDVNVPEVIFFRKWRDETLMESIFGRLFISTYYMISPLMAFIISKTAIIIQIFMNSNLFTMEAKTENSVFGVLYWRFHISS